MEPEIFADQMKDRNGRSIPYLDLSCGGIREYLIKKHTGKFLQSTGEDR